MLRTYAFCVEELELDLSLSCYYIYKVERRRWNILKEPVSHVYEVFYDLFHSRMDLRRFDGSCRLHEDTIDTVTTHPRFPIMFLLIIYLSNLSGVCSPQEHF